VEPYVLHDTVVYGPVESRRYGLSLGINLLPFNQKICTLNCVYCQLGWTRKYEAESEEFPSLSQIEREVEGALKGLAQRGDSIEALSMCGNGEPTLHPKFQEAINVLIRLRDTYCQEAKIICFTAGTELHRKKITEALRSIDEVTLKLDAGSCKMMQRVHLPFVPYCADHLSIQARKFENLSIQSCFFTGVVDNTTDEAVEDWLLALRRIHADRIEIYSIDRSPPTDKIKPVTIEKLANIADRERSVLPRADINWYPPPICPDGVSNCQ